MHPCASVRQQRPNHILRDASSQLVVPLTYDQPLSSQTSVQGWACEPDMNTMHGSRAAAPCSTHHCAWSTESMVHICRYGLCSSLSSFSCCACTTSCLRVRQYLSCWFSIQWLSRYTPARYLSLGSSLLSSWPRIMCARLCLANASESREQRAMSASSSANLRSRMTFPHSRADASLPAPVPAAACDVPCAAAATTTDGRPPKPRNRSPQEALCCVHCWSSDTSSSAGMDCNTSVAKPRSPDSTDVATCWEAARVAEPPDVGWHDDCSTWSARACMVGKLPASDALPP
mmetsp:Transcript_12885/g.27819  ORF Transcript_12885/g.27819 Transcript_12885/m.27819 type:complete len:288 (-) Transcript_12885:174-1037(-)